MPEEKNNDGGGQADCIFCSILSRQTTAEIVYEGEHSLFFYDISPQAAKHLIGITKTHIASLASLSPGNLEQVTSLLHDLTVVAKNEGLVEGGYRVISNVGSDAGQAVKHLHFHLLGGEFLGPLRC